MAMLRGCHTGPMRMPAHRPRVSVCRVAELTVPAVAPTGSRDEPEKARPFPYPLPMDPQQKTLSNIPLPLFYPLMLAVVGGSGLVGTLAGQALPVERETKQIASYAVGAVAAVSAGTLAVQAKKKRDSAAVVALYNEIVELPEPSDLTPELVASVGSKFGMNMQKDDMDGLTKIYSQYLEALIPSGEVQLKGDEAPKVLAFKTALGLSDEEAAPVHIEVARRLFRQGYESKDRNLQFEQRKAFQRLLYVSQLVFGDQKSAFLLPWRRHFNITDAQVFVARRDNARAIFRAFLEQQGGELQATRPFLRSLREYQQSVKLMDDTASELMKEAARNQAEVMLQKGLTGLRATAKARDTGKVVACIGEALEYSRKLASFSNEEDLVPGLGPVSVTGGAFMAEGRARDRKDLYKVYVEHYLEKEAEFTPQLELDTKDLQEMLNIDATTAQSLQDEMAASLYRRMLREEVVSQRLDQSAEPSEILGGLCDRLRFSPEAALELHKSLYKTKLVALLDANPKLTDANMEELNRIRRILCLPAEAIKAAQKDTAGRVLEEAISDVFMAGAKPVSSSELEKVEAVIMGLRMDPELALDIFKQTARERLKSYVQQALKERGSNQDRKAEAAALKKLVQFNAIVITPLLEKVKGTNAAAKEIAEIMAKAMEAAKAEGKELPPGEAEAAAAATVAANSGGTISKEDSIKAVQKAMQAARGEFGEEERKGQKEISLREDVSSENRALLYKDYLMHTMQGEVVELPVGGVIRRKTSSAGRSADMARLQALGELLGMNQMEVSAVHADLAETAYKAQASEILRSGPMTPEKAAYMEDMRTQFGLTKEQADKATKAAKTEVFGSAAVAAEEGGRWTLERCLELHKQGGNVGETVEENVRRSLYRKEFEKAVSDGTGNLNKDYIMTELPAILGLDNRRVGWIAKELVGTRRRLLLVQAVSKLRQKKTSEIVSSLLDLLSCSRTMPETSQAWGDPSELKEIYGIFCNKINDDSKRAELAGVLGLSSEDATEAQSAAEASGGHGADDDASFF